MKRGRALRIAVVGLAVLVGLVAWLVTRDDGGEGEERRAAVPSAEILGESELVDAVSQLEHPVYWTGPREGTELELEVMAEGGGARVRYVSAGSEPGEAPGESPAIGSYPLADPAQSLEEFAERPEAIVRQAEDGTEVVSSEERPMSVYFVDPGNTVQVEVYDPDPAEAMRQALSGEVRPVE